MTEENIVDEYYQKIHTTIYLEDVGKITKEEMQNRIHSLLTELYNKLKSSKKYK